MSTMKLIMGFKVRHLETRPPVIVTPDTSLEQAITLMRTHRIGYVVVVDRDDLQGILTERDILLKVVGLGVGYEAPVSRFMTPNPCVVHSDDSLVSAVQLMDKGGYRHLPLVDDVGKVVGIVSIRHIVNFIVEHFPEDVMNLPPRLDQKSLTVEGG